MLRQTLNASKIIQQGGLVAFPTETVYGLGANALDPLAVAKIFEIKERPSFDPLIVHIADISEIDNLAKIDGERSRTVRLLSKKFWPGPLTIVLPKKSIVPDIVTAGLPTVGIRMPDNEIALEFIRQSGCPIAAPSANKFGGLSPTTAAHVRKQFPDLEIIDGGPAKVGIESTVIALQEDGFCILRKGLITKEDIESVLPASAKTVEELASPGLLKSHYSPAKPLYLLGTEPKLDKKKTGYLALKKAPDSEGFARTEVLSPNGDLRAAAANLFGALHRLEEATDIDCIIAEPVPETGIGLAIMDKLHKAAYRYTPLSL